MRTGTIVEPGRIAGDDGQVYAFDGYACLRNGTSAHRLTPGAIVYFGSVEPGVAAWVSWRPVDEDSARGLDASARHALTPRATP